MKKAILLALGMIHAFVSSQNLVPNGGFEEYRKCPKGLGDLEKCNGWFSPNNGTPDFFAKCYTRDLRTVGVPNNYFGLLAPFHGANYAGILNGQQEKEYIMVQLSEPLIAGKRYCVRFRAATPSTQSEDRAEIGLFLSPNQYSTPTWDALDIPMEQWVPLAENHSLGQRTWVLYSGIMVAKGGEQFLGIGYRQPSSQGTYTFLDEIEVFESSSPDGCGEPTFIAEDPDSNNFVANPGFELMFDCPNRREEIHKAKNWAYSLNTPDFYHACGTGSAAVPENQLGYQMPYAGNGYGGFWVNIVQHDYAEYVSTRLKRRLEAGKTYCLSMWVSLAEVSDHAIDAMHLYLVPENRSVQDPDFLSRHPHITLTNNKLLDNRTEWTQLFGTFQADGTESTILIGYFAAISDSVFYPIGRSPAIQSSFKDCAYYYIDEIGLYELDAPACPCPGMKIMVDGSESPQPSGSQPRWEAGQSWVLHNLQFGYNKSTLLPQSLPILDSLANLIDQNQQLSIHIIGHTDSDGNADYNLRLSEQRAESVKAYLIQRGISPRRLRSQGKGETVPLYPNDSEIQKAFNRRVEILLQDAD